MTLRSVLLFLVGLLGVVGDAGAQVAPGFDPENVWSSTSSVTPPTPRQGHGRPGPSYWQNHADYTIRAELDTANNVLRGKLSVTYTNNSPAPLSSLWLYVGPDSSKWFRPSPLRRSRARVSGVRVAPTEHAPVKVVRRGAKMQLRLDGPVAPNGDTVTVDLQYRIRPSPSSTPNVERIDGSSLYTMTHWYPRILAYTPTRGWATRPSSSSRVYTEYGSYDYFVTVPANLIVAGSGTLMNPGEVLTLDQRRRLMRARNDRTKVAIITPSQAGQPDTRPTQSGTLTWHFRMNGVREVGWAASASLIWNAAMVRRPGNRDALAMSYYPPSSLGANAWNRSTNHTQRAAEFFSRHLYPYPWNNAVNIATPLSARALPGLSFCPHTAAGYDLFSCSVQNQAKNWFSEIVGPNTRRHPWMRRGLATYASVLAHRRLHDGEFAPKNDVHFPAGGTPADAIAEVMADTALQPITFPPANDSAESTRTRQSFRPAVGFLLLRENLLDPTRVDYALREYFQRWAFKAPLPSHLFRTISDATGSDLSWFWTSWFRHAWRIDPSIETVTYDARPAPSATLTLQLHRRHPVPLEIRVTSVGGDTTRARVPVRAWRNGPRISFSVPTSGRPRRATVDPDHDLPDVNRDNNTWAASDLRSARKTEE